MTNEPLTNQKIDNNRATDQSQVLSQSE